MARRCASVPEVPGSRFTEPEPIAGTRGTGTARTPRRRAAEVTGSTRGAMMSDASLRLPSSHVRDAHASGPDPTRGPRIGEAAGDIFCSRSSSATGTNGAHSEFHRRRSWLGRPIARVSRPGPRSRLDHPRRVAVLAPMPEAPRATDAYEKDSLFLLAGGRFFSRRFLEPLLTEFFYVALVTF